MYGSNLFLQVVTNCSLGKPGGIHVRTIRQTLTVGPKLCARLEATVPLSFAPGEAVQVDFGAGPMLPDADGVFRRTWAFAMTLAFSRHHYVEFVWDQSVVTWLGCHRRAFEWFGGVPTRVIIDFVAGNKIDEGR